MPNHLTQEISPYLQQHAHNPVEWYPWGEVAFKRARAEDKPILLSIGYSACHWCHVMAHESFEDESIAQIMNEHFINIKVDKEERPDIDSVYMSAVQMMSGSGGWPLTVFLTPEGTPFYGGTYYPPSDRHGMPGLPAVLKMVSSAYREHKGKVLEVSSRLVNILSTMTGESNSQYVSMETLDSIFTSFRKAFDFKNGGFGSAPKFPQAMFLDFLLRHYHRTGNAEALAMVEKMLDKMAVGGIYDHIGGGFHRYSTDSSWIVPHFEKMLYDNALLSKAYLDAYLVTHKLQYKKMVEGIIDYILREMSSPYGGFYSSQDADSEGIEGKYYLWSLNEIKSVLGDDLGNDIADYYGIAEHGNFEGQNILHINRDKTLDNKKIEEANIPLLNHRMLRIPPFTDDKILASWNGLMLYSLAEAAKVLNRADYKKAAIKSGEFLISLMSSCGSLKHVFKNGKAHVEGQLQDYAFVIGGLLSLHELTIDTKWIKHAISLTETMIDVFWVEDEKRFYDTADRQDLLFLRPRHIYDDALPSGVSFAVMMLLKLALITGEQRYRDIAASNIESIAEMAAKNPAGFANWAGVLDFYLSKPKEIAMLVNEKQKDALDMYHVLHSKYFPNKVFVACPGDNIDICGDISLMKARGLVNNRSTIYICENFTCKEPVTDVEKLLDIMDNL